MSASTFVPKLNSASHSIQGRRPSMEDKDVLINNLSKEYTFLEKYSLAAFYAIFDGHGGEKCSELCKKLLHETILKNSKFQNDDYIQGIKEGYIETDRLIKISQFGWGDSGSTAVTVFIIDDKLYVANVGDSEALIVSKENEFKIITEIHNPTIPSEEQRIEDFGGNN